MRLLFSRKCLPCALFLDTVRLSIFSKNPGRFFFRVFQISFSHQRTTAGCVQHREFSCALFSNLVYGCFQIFDPFSWPWTECLALSFQKKKLFTETTILLATIELVSLEPPGSRFELLIWQLSIHPLRQGRTVDQGQLQEWTEHCPTAVLKI